MQFKKLALSIAAITTLGVCGTVSAYTSHEEQIIVHPFQWTYDMIADECEQVLGPNGFDGVQISQPAEHLNKKEVWWSVYQPVNFKNFTTVAGNEQQLRSMIKRCNDAGVRVYVDAVFNQRASDYFTHYGTAGSYFDSGKMQYPDMGPEDFNNYGCSIDYSDRWKVYHCALNGMPDLNVLRTETQDKIADYLKNLLSMGVYGFRVDAAKHMQPEGIAAILAKVGNPFTYLEVIGAKNEAVQPGDYTSIPNSVVTEFRYCPTMQNNIKNPKVLLDMADNWFDVYSDGAETFVNNHDNERGSAGTTYMNYKDPRYSIAQSFLVAWPYGKVRQVYSGYQFSAHDPAGPIGADRCQGGWNCDHRVSVVLNAVGFARATRGYGVSYKGASDDGKVIWFTRGDKGFYVMNSGDAPIKWTFDTHMPDGQYCEILQQPEKCGGQQINVKNGKAEIMVYDKSAAAICIDDSGKGFCGGEPVCKDPNGCPPPVPSKDLYFVGTTNGWKHQAMECADGTCKIQLQLTGAGDSNGAQRFKLTSAADWKHDIWGDGGNGSLCKDEVKCPDIVITEQGSYTLTVDTASMTWKLTSGSDNHAPVAEFNHSTNGLTANFKNKSHDEDGDGLYFSWDFGDGQVSDDAEPSVTYSQAGTYTVKLTVSDGKESASTEQQVTVSDVVCSPKNDELYFAGTTNGWSHDAMTFDTEACKWSIELNLTGAGDSNGAQRFKVTTAPNWKAKVYGSKDGKTLCSDQSKCGDIKISQKGNYKLLVDDNAHTWEFVENGGSYIAPTRDAMYYAGTTNKWSHQKMSYNSQTGDWEITLELTGAGDKGGAQRFKVTSSANWKGTVWGDAGGNSLCSNQASCGDVYIGEVGTYVLKVNDKNLTWVLDPK